LGALQRFEFQQNDALHVPATFLDDGCIAAGQEDGTVCFQDWAHARHVLIVEVRCIDDVQFCEQVAFSCCHPNLHCSRICWPKLTDTVPSGPKSATTWSPAITSRGTVHAPVVTT